MTVDSPHASPARAGAPIAIVFHGLLLAGPAVAAAVGGLSAPGGS